MAAFTDSSVSQAKQKIRQTLDAQEITVILSTDGQPSSRLRARFVAQIGDGLKIHVTTALGPGIVVGVAGEIETASGTQPLLGQYEVRSCVTAGLGKYIVDLAPHRQTNEPPPRPARRRQDLDYYEVLQVSRHADTDTIHRIYHVLAQRYHPDNPDTGNVERFRQLAEAHAVLSDKERRAAYDVQLISEDKTRIKIFDSLESTEGVQAEIRKREGILKLLYTRRLVDPHNPTMRGREFAEMLGCPAEHLEFSLWQLREKRLIHRSDNNQFEITSLGVDAFEAMETNFSRKPVLRLPEATSTARDSSE